MTGILMARLEKTEAPKGLLDLRTRAEVRGERWILVVGVAPSGSKVLSRVVLARALADP